jgi:hypothetical protein
MRISGERWVRVGNESMLLSGPGPKPGDALCAQFSLEPWRNAPCSLDHKTLCNGRVIVATLPNISRHHRCAGQVLELERCARVELPGFRLIHVINDGNPVCQYHPELEAESYTLEGTSEASRAAFTSAFGVAVADRRCIAHALFALVNGRWAVVRIPEQQLELPDVRDFIRCVTAALDDVDTKRLRRPCG